MLLALRQPVELYELHRAGDAGHVLVMLVAGGGGEMSRSL